MWNSKLVECARQYAEGTLTVVDASDYPVSVRCEPSFDDSRELVVFHEPPPLPVDWGGKACLTFHRHNTVLEDFHEMIVKGELVV